MTPATLSLYELAAHELGGARSIIDGGCGSGAGAELLTHTFPEVVAIDYDPEALASARERAPKARIVAGDLAALVDVAPTDAVVLVDVLGHAKSPEGVLASLRDVLGQQNGQSGAAPARLFIAERLAYPPQFLAPPVRRAFTAPWLERLLAGAGFEIAKWLTVDGSFLACVAQPFFEPAWEDLCRAYGDLSAGRTEGVESAFEKAEKEGSRPSVRLAAAVGLANLSLARRDADGAIGACFRARDIEPRDVRPAALLARVALAVGETTEAERLANLACELDPGDVEGAYARAVVATHAKSGAKEGWLAASNLAPDSLDVAARLASVSIEEQDSDLAIFALERVRAYGDDHGASLHIALGWALLSAGRKADALLEARVAARLLPGDPGVRTLVANCQPSGA
jgi:SAM-dependent methyltransferase/Flp pilus assembly protein TadD